MSRRGTTALLALAAVLLPAAPAAAQAPMPQTAVGDATVHDPSLVTRGVTPRYALFSTHNQGRLSADRTVWASIGGPLQPVPDWTRPYGNGDMWAPDVSFHDGRYWLYYAASTPTGGSSAIGLATSTSAEPGSWVDRGMVIDSNGGSPYNAIDPDLLVDVDGRWWLTFGNGSRGVHVIELDPATGKVKSGASSVRIANGDLTAPVMYRHDGLYYLFAAYGSCCPPLDGSRPPTSNIRVGRSSSPTGPFVDRDGVAMLQGGATRILEAHAHVRGPGGPDVVFDTRDDETVLAYHWYDQRLNYTSFLGINRLVWDAQGWPSPQ